MESFKTKVPSILCTFYITCMCLFMPLTFISYIVWKRSHWMKKYYSHKPNQLKFQRIILFKMYILIYDKICIFFIVKT